MKRLHLEHRVNVSVYVRAKDEAAARAFADQLNALIRKELDNWMRWRVTWTGSHIDVETL